MSGWQVLMGYAPVFPEVLLLVGACALMIVDLYVKDEGKGLTLWLAQGLLLACAVLTLLLFFGQSYTGGLPRLMLGGLFVSDLMSHLLKFAAYASTAVTLVYSRRYLADRGLLRGEFITLLLFSLLGIMIMISAASFLTIYLVSKLSKPDMMAEHRGSAPKLPAPEPMPEVAVAE